ncbi:MAG: glycerol kinase GlpK [Bryobacterales bacterium]|nr:glycerol kinase GlpK [Bryobacterales bacterium]
MQGFVLSCDEGTSSARAIAFDREARAVQVAQRPLASSFPHSGWVEQDPEDIWQAQVRSAAQVAEACGGWERINAIGITNQRETTVVWDRATGLPVAPAIVWQCRRTAPECAALRAAGHADLVTGRTGLVLDPYFSGTKIAWILENVDGARQRAEAGDLAFGTVDSWLVYRLTGGARHVIDRTNASRTLLMDLRTGSWDNDLMGLLGIPAAMLPEIVPSCGVVAMTDPSVTEREIPIAGIAGDQQAALFGQACFRPGLVKNTYGTGCFALLHTGQTAARSANRLLSTTAASAKGKADFALEGSIFVGGAVVQWLRDELGLIATAAESEHLATAVEDSGGVFMVPAFTGLGAPYWNAAARGLLCGLTRGARREHIVRAALEAIAYQTRDLVEAMQSDAGSGLSELRVDGGATENNFLMQFQADILGVPVVRPAFLETTALGAAFLAGLATGYWSGTEELERFWSVDRTFEPTMEASRREELYGGWKTAVARAQ